MWSCGGWDTWGLDAYLNQASEPEEDPDPVGVIDFTVNGIRWPEWADDDDIGF